MPHGKPVARYHVIEMTLASRIRDGHYGAEGLPGERVLAAEFGAARVTIRSALKRLEDQGLVIRSERRGTLAATAAGKPRRLLREHVDSFLDRGRRDKRKVLFYRHVDATPVVADALAVAPGTKVLRVVRLRSDAAGTLTYTEAFVAPAIAHALSRAALERKAFVQLLEDHGFAIRVAEQVVSSERVPYEVAQALGIALDAPVLKLARVIRGDAGAPLQYMLGWYRADRFEVRMNMSRADDATKVWIAYR
ncbi:GntR family transcriptional regulator [Ramlibacter albus]|uniref:GntR family transcriptional regulator n=1 Tax=Ramlibacter albus TaxID=2079448 RepID=A0A923M824_9BURK|nr:GntR family transcriptional regulator [Ramlibacter albus]MBC5764546.1 GntR family transcriptional regulator [Ramlibacter albus]